VAHFFATYAGTVESTSDPERVGRLKVRVPLIYGPSSSNEAISVSDLPWALPAGLPAGGTAQSGGMVWLPQVGDHVWVRFLDGEAEKPIWEWGAQDTKQAAAYRYFRLQDGGYEASGAAPTMGMLTRYGHAIQLSPGAVVLSSSGGYTYYVNDSDEAEGQLGLRTARGYLHEFDDSTDTLLLYVRNYTANVSYLFFTGDDYKWVVTDQAEFDVGNTFAVTAGVSASFDTPEFDVSAAHLELGMDADDPVVRLSDLQAAIDTVTAFFNDHQHTGNLGAPTSPPLAPMEVTGTGSPTTFST